MRKLTLGLLALAALSVVSCGGGPERYVEGDPLFSDVGQHVLPDARHVELECEITVSDIPKGAKEVQVWAPFPQDTPAQMLGETTLSHPTSYRPAIRYDQRYQARYLYVSASAPLPKSFKMSYEARVSRARIEDHFTEVKNPLPAAEIRQRYGDDLKQENLAKPPEGTMTPDERAAWQRSAEIEFEQKVAEILNAPAVPSSDNSTEGVAAALDAAQQAASETGKPLPTTRTDDIARARAVYDYVIYTMTPEEALTGGERRSAREVLESARGDAMDYALVTVALLRAAGIPARVETGLLLSEDKTPDRVEVVRKGAWVRFLVGGRVWTACDPYTADVTPDLREYMFRGVCANRIQLGSGPGEVFEEAPKSGAPGALAEVIAEADGKRIPVKCVFQFRDVAGGHAP
jgi:transglutaminase-like putative cysteine protease